MTSEDQQTGDPFEGNGGAVAATTSDDPFESDSSDLEPDTGDAAAEVDAQPPADVPPADTPPADVTAEDPPVVDREGQPVDLPETMTAAGRAKAAEAAQEAAGAAEAAVEAPPAPQTQTGDGDGGQPPAEDPPAPAQTEPPADPPAESGKKGELRLYKLLYQTASTTWEEAPLADVKDDLKKYVKKDGDELFLEARNNDHARRLAFTLLGRPDNGVTVELVARTSWKPKRLSVAPPEPTRERLVIS